MKRRFQCVGPECDRCCYGTRADKLGVALTLEDIGRLGRDFHRVSVAKFAMTPDGPVRRAEGPGMAIVIKKGERCPLYEDGVGCSVHDRKPLQCQSYPWGWTHLQAPEAWEKEAERCPGIGHGPLVKLRSVAA